MALRRMFSIEIVGSDQFLDMPTETRELYFHLGMYADDDGFLSPKKIIRMIGASDDNLKLLIAKGFVIPFESGVVVITHWQESNYIQKDRYKPTIHQLEYSKLSCIQNVYKLDTQGRVGKGRVGEVRKGKERIETGQAIVAKPPDEVNILLDFFKNTVNEHISFGNKTERKACADLLKTYGLEKTQAALLFIEEKRKTDRYLPVITTPYELWTKWAKIKQHLTTKTTKIIDLDNL